MTPAIPKADARTYAMPAGTRAAELTGAQSKVLFERGHDRDAELQRDVAELIADVRARGDAALRDQARRFDGADGARLEVPRHDWEAALATIDAAVRRALEQAAASIAVFHRAQLPLPLELERDGLLLGRRADALQRVGVYAPGGRAAYPSSVLMGVVPARVAGVRDVVVCSPAGPGGSPPAEVLAACAIGGADRVFATGGAGAIAALAFGTATVARVDKVVGPGNAYVTEAKRQLNGTVATDGPAGPSEVLVLADDTADAELVAWELLAQAEHDADAACVLATTTPELVDAVAVIIERELRDLPRAGIIAAALRARGALLVGDDIDELLAFAARYAPEHLVVHVRDARRLLPRVRNAGTVFLGSSASVAFGDYITGANHVLPTGGMARAYSGLSVLDFIRWTTYQHVEPAAAARLAGVTAVLAEAEGLSAHARAARLRARVPA